MGTEKFEGLSVQCEGSLGAFLNAFVYWLLVGNEGTYSTGIIELLLILETIKDGHKGPFGSSVYSS